MLGVRVIGMLYDVDEWRLCALDEIGDESKAMFSGKSNGGTLMIQVRGEDEKETRQILGKLAATLGAEGLLGTGISTEDGGS